jgi:hypothetical protein
MPQVAEFIEGRITLLNKVLDIENDFVMMWGAAEKV